MTRPLWELMCKAYMDAPVGDDAESTEGLGYAAELRAVADWLRISLAAQVRPDDLQKVAAALEAEADRAEAGE